MKVRKFLNIAVSLLVLSGLLFGNTPGMVRAENAAMPMDPMDETKVPHYFGPNPNWANSPFTLPDVQVIITGNGTGATAEATVVRMGASLASPSPIQDPVIRTQRSISCPYQPLEPGLAQRPM